MRRFLKLFLVAALLVVAFTSFTPSDSVLLADDADFEDNYDYYCQLCSTKSKLSDDEKTTCREFRNYEERKQKDLKAMLDDAKANLNEMKNNIFAQGQKIAEYNSQIKILEKQIDAINASIVLIGENIEALNLQIQEREEKIDQLNTQIKDRMAANQLNVRTNSYIRFIMGADSFVDLLRRISAINEITGYDLGKIDEMEHERELLQADVEELQEQKDLLFVQQTELETKKTGLENLVEYAQELMEEFQRQEAAFYEQMAALEKDYSVLQANIEEINRALNRIEPSAGFGHFFRNTNFFVSTGAYYYAGGGYHPAIDLAVSVGTNLYAVASGVVVDVGRGCSANGGYMGNTCNWGRGNFVFYLSNINGKYYFFQCDHLSTVNVGIGETISQGQLIGTTGNSGNSSGAHLHFAIHYLGNDDEISVQDILSMFMRYDNTFGLPSNISAACANRGWRAPCVVNPSEIYGFYYPNYYYVGY